jgi:hypothetical protein
LPAYTTNEDLSDEDIVEQSQLISTVRDVIDPDSADRKRAAYLQELERRKKEEFEYGSRIVAARERIAKQEVLDFERRSMGRSKMIKGPRHVLFVDHVCEFCDSKVKKVLSGWNINRTMMNFNDYDISYDSEFINENHNHSKVHECPASLQVLAKQIQGLRNDLKDYKKFADEYFNHQPTL